MFKPHEFAEKIGVSVKTLQRWDNSGKLPAKRTPSGHRFYTENDLLIIQGLKPTEQHRKNIVYCRVSSNGQKPELRNQITAMETFCLNRGLAVDEWVSEIGGGLNFKRKKFLSIRFVSNSRNGTLLHTRSFLSYHGGKFEDLSLIFEDDKGNIIGIFPSAIDLQQRDIVVSHPGITYGGIVHNGCLRGEKMLYALQSMMCKYQEEGFHSIRYKAIPYIYHQVPTSDDLYAIFLVGGVCYRKDLSSTIDIANRPKLSKGRRYFLRKAEKSCIMVKDGYQYLEDFWTILTDNLAGKYDAKPLHSLAEIQSLFKMFPDSIKCLVAIKDAQVVAGTVIFQTRQVIHTQYLATNQKGRDISALDLIIESSILEAKKQGIRYFNFGTSTEQDGSLNTNLYQYKSEFGSGGVVHEFYEIDIRK